MMESFENCNQTARNRKRSFNMTEKEFRQIVRSNICGDGYDANERMQEILDAHKATIKTISIKSTQPKKGKWVDLTYYNVIYHCENQVIASQMIEAMCSNCCLYSDFESNRFNNIVNFCPHCGADMRKSE